MAALRRTVRLDELLIERGLAGTLAEATVLIRAGKVLVSETVADKPGHRYRDDAPVRTKRALPFVSRGGIKLEGGLKHFDLDPTGWVCADIGASTGGFTDCLLQHGASFVYAIDVAYGVLHWKLRCDPRVSVLERLNVKYLSGRHLSQPLDLAVFDTSFISLAKVIPPVLPFFDCEIRVLALVKPQFELPQRQVGKGGIVESETDRLDAVRLIERFGRAHGLTCAGYSRSILTGAKGNQEYLIYLKNE